MKVSIGIPAYDAEKYLRCTLESVLRQTFLDWEVIVVDDGATDATAQIAQEFVERDARFRLVRQTNSGVAAARNRAQSEMSASSEYVIFLDADDIWEDDALAILVSALDSSQEAVAAYGRARLVDAQGNLMLNYVRGWEAPQRLNDFSSTNFAMLAAGTVIIATPGLVLIRRSALSAAGCWDTDPNIKPCEDLDMWFRLTLAGHFTYVPQNVLMYRIHASNASGNSRMIIRSDRAVRRKIYSLVKSIPERQQEMRVGYSLFEQMIARNKLESGMKLFTQFNLLGGCRQVAYSLAHLLRGFRGFK